MDPVKLISVIRDLMRMHDNAIVVAFAVVKVIYVYGQFFTSLSYNACTTCEIYESDNIALE